MRFSPLTTLFFVLALPHGTSYAICKDATLTKDAARTRTASFVQEMKIAKARGDIQTMSTRYQTYYKNFAGTSCTADEFAQICGYDCQIELAEYNLFMANDLAYYYQSSSAPLKKEKVLEFAQEGIRIVQTARDVLLQNRPADVRDYVFRSGRFAALLGRLYMTIGDIWYQSVSEIKLQRLQFLVGSTVQQAGEGTKKSETALARENYDKANWVIQSGAMDVPPTDEYNEVQSDLFGLNYDVSNRLGSLDKGYLFLNLNPETYSQIPYYKLKARLDTLVGKIKEAEGKVENLMKEWKVAQAGQSIDDLNTKDRQRELSISNSSFRIAKLEDAAEEMSIQINKKLEEVKQKGQTFAYEREKYQFQAGLEMKITQLKDQQELLMSRKEANTSGFEKEDAERRLGEIRWLMSWEVSKANIEVQLSQFNAEIERYNGDIATKNTLLAQNVNDVAITNEKIKIADYNIGISQTTQKSLELEKGALATENIRSYEAELCGVKTKMAYIGSPAPAYNFQVYNCAAPTVNMDAKVYHQKMCGPKGIRPLLKQKEIDSVAKAICALGFDSIDPDVRADSRVAGYLSNCGSIAPMPQLEFAREIMAREMALADQRIKSSENNRALVEKQLRLLKDLIREIETSKVILSDVVDGLNVAINGLSAMPQVTQCACGLASGVLTRFDLDAPLESALAIASFAYSKYTDWASFKMQNQLKIDEMDRLLQTALDSIEENKLAKDVKSFAALQAITEIIGRSSVLQTDLASQILEKDTVIVDCDKESEDLKQSQGVLQASFDQVKTQIAATELKTQNIDREIQIEISTRAKEESSKNIYASDLANLTLTRKGLDAEIGTINKLISNAHERKKTIEQLQGRLSGLENESKAKAAAIEELAKLYHKQLLALDQKEYDQLTKVINQEETFTQKMIGFVEDVNKLEHIDAGLRTKLLEFKESINIQVKDEREKILNTIYMQQQTAGSGERGRLFMASQEDMATLSKGVPSFIKQKRQLMEEANRMLVLLRNQINALSSLQGNSPLSLNRSDPLIYVKNSDDLERLKDVIESPFWEEDQAITTITSKITIPSSSGLARTLAVKKRADFEINPFARNQMAELGYFSLWNSDFDLDGNGLTQNLILIDMNLLLEFPSCSPSQKRITITHKGSGYVFKQTSPKDTTSVPFLIAAEPRSYQPSYYVSTANLEKIEEFWALNFNLNNFLETSRPPNFADAGSLPPLLGLPVLGRYEILLPEPSPGCSYENAGYKLYVTYATRKGN